MKARSSLPPNSRMFRTRPHDVMQLGAVPLMTILACAAGCRTTIDNRLALPEDSVAEWEPKLTSIPIDIHGLADETAGVARDMASAQRIELYVDRADTPAATRYCAGNPLGQPTEMGGGRVVLTAALCDGTRLVVITRRRMEVNGPRDLSDDVIKSIKRKIIFALSMSPAQIPTEGGG